MKVFQREHSLRTKGGLEIRDITDEVKECVADSGVNDGIACVYSPHTTCCVRVNEFETGFLEDFVRMGIGLLSVTAGLTISYYGNLAPGGAIVLLAAGFAVAAVAGAPFLNRTR